MRLLLVEDDRRIASFLEKGLRAEGYVTETAASAREADESLRFVEFDVVLLDLGLPDESGLEVLRRLRSKDRSLPVVVLTARAEVRDKVVGLDLGANDYVTKPFSFEELLARLRAVVRSASQPEASELVVGDLRLDLLTKIAYRDGRPIELAPREWALLELFMRRPRHVLSRARILDQVWQYGFDPGSNVVDVYVGYLRRKLNLPGLVPLIQTVRGAGYRLIAPEAEGDGATA
ncbi:MAG TPA: response regulator transcription factor [Acidimicrobiales bacterium]|nr:response regulator transcription factor [Acidimicrobiales bacterium]